MGVVGVLGKNGTMSLPGSPSAALRGAVDLSTLGRSTPAPATSSSAAAGILLEVTDTTFEEAFLATKDVPALFVLWDGQAVQTRAAVDAAVEAAAGFPGRLRVCSVDVRQAPRMAQAFQVQQVPMTLAIIAGQPVPLFAGAQPAAQLRPVVEQVLQLAAQHGVTGRFEVGQEQPDPEGSADLPVAHAQAYQAIEDGDYAAAVAAYQQALKDDPADTEAKAGLAQVTLLQRVEGVDAAAARAAAAANPVDVAANTLVADLDLVGGHVEDAFARLVDLVRMTAEDERNAARAHLLELFEVVGASDERVAKARRALMSALF